MLGSPWWGEFGHVSGARDSGLLRAQVLKRRQEALPRSSGRLQEAKRPEFAVLAAVDQAQGARALRLAQAAHDCCGEHGKAVVHDGVDLRDVSHGHVDGDAGGPDEDLVPI